MATYYVGSAGNDSNTGTSAGSGNEWLTLQKAADTAVAGDKVWVKNDKTYTEQVDFDTNAGTGSLPITFEGYSSTIGDSGQVTVSGSGSRASCFVFNGTADHVTFKNFILKDATTQSILGATAVTDGISWHNCQIVKGTSTASRGTYAGGYNRFNNWRFLGCVISGFTGDGVTALTGVATFDGCKIVDNGGNGINIPSYGSGLRVLRSIIAGNTLDGVVVGGGIGSGVLIEHSTIEGNGGDGLDINGATNGSVVIRHNIIANHSGVGDVGLRVGTISGSTTIGCDYNYYYNNTTHRSGNNTTGDHDQTLTADPFTNSASDNWTLNNTAGGGAAVRAASGPSIDATNIGYSDGGALQHQDSGGGGSGTNVIIPAGSFSLGARES